MTIAVIDFGLGNVGSVANMLRKLGRDAVVTSDPDVVTVADRIVLPGVGAFDAAMENLERTGLAEVLKGRVERDEVPLLGICLGMQLLAGSSEEGSRAGLGWIPGRVRRLPSCGAAGPVRVPHMGWNRLRQVRASPMLDHLEPDARFYFVHSYALSPDDGDVVVALTHYSDDFVSVVQRNNISGMQFHPEKSHRHGRAILAAWIDT